MSVSSNECYAMEIDIQGIVNIVYLDNQADIVFELPEHGLPFFKWLIVKIFWFKVFSANSFRLYLSCSTFRFAIDSKGLVCKAYSQTQLTKIEHI